MPYYAHIRQDENGETIYQTVAEHLTGKLRCAESLPPTSAQRRTEI